MNVLKKHVNYEMLEKELHNVLCKDELYKLQNDAKLRAIKQKVQTYNDFKEMVNAAHLKPLELKTIKNKSKVSWNLTFKYSSSDGYLKCLQNCEHKSEKETVVNLRKLPRTSDEFFRTWRNILDPTMKLEYLFCIRSIMKDRIFQVEVPSSFIINFVNLSQTIISSNNINIIIELLQILSQCNRFHLNMAFLSRENRQSCTDLFQTIISKTMTEKKNIVKSLVKEYKIQLDIKDRSIC